MEEETIDKEKIEGEIDKAIDSIIEETSLIKQELRDKVIESLSDKIQDEMGNFHFVEVEDVREAVRRLKKLFNPEDTWGTIMLEEIDEIFGDKLT